MKLTRWERIRLSFYVTDWRDVMKILLVGAITFIGTLIVLGLLTASKKEGHLFCTGHPPVCVHETN